MLQPSRWLHELFLLNALKSRPDTSQALLGKAIGVTPAMVNSYLKRFEAEGLLRRAPINLRSMQYVLTDHGEDRRTYLLVTYLSELIALYTTAKDEMRRRFETIKEQGIRTIAFYAAGETAEVAGRVIWECGLKLVAIVDDDPKKQGCEFFGLHVEPPTSLRSIEVDAIIITTCVHQEAIKKKIGDLGLKDRAVIPI